MNRYLTMGELLVIQAEQVDRIAGAPGVRDACRLDAALQRPQVGHYADVPQAAAALWESLLQGLPFRDANESTAFVAMSVYLHLNGWQLIADAGLSATFIRIRPEIRVLAV